MDWMKRSVIFQNLRSKFINPDMRLTVNNKAIALPLDGKISIERVSPFMNDNSGSYSFPFPVPTLPNQQNLDWPGKLQRVGDVVDQTFILEENGIQILRGAVAYDSITRDEIGLVLQSGNTEFSKKMEGETLSYLDLGSEWFPYYIDAETNPTNSFLAKFAAWDLANTTDNGIYVVAPFQIKLGTTLFTVNLQQWSGAGDSHLAMYDTAGSNPLWNANAWFCLQFRIYYLIEKIFESAGYLITEDELKDSEFSNTVIFGKVLYMTHEIRGRININLDKLHYNQLMPDNVEVLTFLKTIKDLFCMVYLIDEKKKEVKIKFKKDLFLAENLSSLPIMELEGWSHQETRASKGFTLKYVSQDSEWDTKSNYPEWVNQVYNLPAPLTEGEILNIPRLDRDYVTIRNTDNALVWQEIGRLKDFPELAGEEVAEIGIQVPGQSQYVEHSITLESPLVTRYMQNNYTMMYYERDFTSNMPLSITLYHGRKTFAGLVNYPYCSASKISMDGLINTGMSLKPVYLYNAVYAEFLNWKTYRAREFTKYIELSLNDVVALQWGKRYVIDGVVVILNKINYELPYCGIVELDGFTG